MNIYKIVLDEGRINDIEHHVLAKDFDDASAQAQTLLQNAKAKDKKASHLMEIIVIRKEFELEVVK